MVLRNMMLAIALGFLAIAWHHSGVSQERADESKTLVGLWHGSWGGGERDGAIFTPVIAEMVIEGDRIEIHNFPEVGKLQGTVRLDADKRRILISPAAPAAGEPAKVVEYNYEIAKDKLTLRVGDKEAVTLQKLPVVQNPLANVQAEFVAAAGINEAGDLLVTRITALRANSTGSTHLQSEEQKLRTKQAVVFEVQQSGMKSVTLESARQLVRQAPAVVITYRQDEEPLPPKTHELWQHTGSAPPDHEAALQTFARTLRPGTLVFVLSARENIPQP